MSSEERGGKQNVNWLMYQLSYVPYHTGPKSMQAQNGHPHTWLSSNAFRGLQQQEAKSVKQPHAVQHHLHEQWEEGGATCGGFCRPSGSWADGMGRTILLSLRNYALWRAVMHLRTAR